MYGSRPVEFTARTDAEEDDDSRDDLDNPDDAKEVKMSKMGQELERKLDENKYEMYEALEEIVAEGTRCLDMVQQDKPVREIYNIDKVDKIARRAIAKIEGGNT